MQQCGLHCPGCLVQKVASAAERHNYLVSSQSVSQSGSLNLPLPLQRSRKSIDHVLTPRQLRHLLLSAGLAATLLSLPGTPIPGANIPFLEASEAQLNELSKRAALAADAEAEAAAAADGLIDCLKQLADIVWLAYCYL